MLLTKHHPRRFGTLRYVYPVISRRSGGLSLGINLSPTGLCNFACVYCQILAEFPNIGQEQQPAGDRDRADDRDRAGDKADPGKTNLRVPLDVLEAELRHLIGSVSDGSLFKQPAFAAVPNDKRVLKDIAFSGDGEPTLSPQLLETIRLVERVRKDLCEPAVKIVLITNASTLHLAATRSAIDVMFQNNGEIWAKLDAGTDEFYRTVSRSNVPFHNICSNLVDFTRDNPVVIQTCFLSLHGNGPGVKEIGEYTERLKALSNVKYVHIYTVARHTPETWALPLENQELEDIARDVRQQTSMDVRVFHSG